MTLSICNTLCTQLHGKTLSKALHCAETRHMMYRLLKTVHECGWARQTAMPHAFQWGGQPPKCPFSLGDLDPNLIHGSLGLTESAPQTASRSVQLFFFAVLTNVTNGPTDRLTDRTTMLL